MNKLTAVNMFRFGKPNAIKNFIKVWIKFVKYWGGGGGIEFGNYDVVFASSWDVMMNTLLL